MQRPTRSERSEKGDTLIEILLAIVIMGLIMGAIFATYTDVSQASGTGRSLVTADAVLRNSAEATKSAVRNSCAGGGSTYSVTFSAPTGFIPPANIVGASCPPTTGTPAAQVAVVPLQVTTPGGIVKTLSVAVRTP